MSIPPRARRKPGSEVIETLRDNEPESSYTAVNEIRYRRTQFARAHNTNGISVPTGTSLLAFNTTHYDTSNYIRSTSTHRLYVPVRGYYYIVGGYYEVEAASTRRCFTVHYVSPEGADSVKAHTLYDSADGKGQQITAIARAELGGYFYCAMVNNGPDFNAGFSSDYSPEISIVLLGVDEADMPSANDLISIG